MQLRHEEGAETTAIARLVSLDGRHVLDVGCGRGRLTAFAAARAASVYVAAFLCGSATWGENLF
jgi:cyclopropane fatty-acyl-phospholipid synthase-like methyltransferase